MINKEFIEKIEDMTGPKVIEPTMAHFQTSNYTELRTDCLIQSNCQV